MSKLIFDLGLHTGKDTEFYLRKGFKVVALEANPGLAEQVTQRLADYISVGQLTIIQRALWDGDEDEVSFFVNDIKDDWSSLYKNVAEKGVHVSREIKVKTTSLEDIFQSHGHPYYIKCDMENADRIFVASLLRSPIRPSFVSVEITDLQLPAILYAAGYDRFQIVNQQFNRLTVAPDPAREGSYVKADFDGHTSGLFGMELERNAWKDFDATINLLSDAYRVRAAHPNIVVGWFDIHATRAAVLRSPSSAR